MARICLDNGHGLKTGGKRTPSFPNTNKVVHEWEFNHATAKKLKRILESQGHQVLMVSDTEADTPLFTRVLRANQWKADIFVSIHYNAFQGLWGLHGGIEVLYRSSKGMELAELVQTELIKATGLRDRKVKLRTDLAVLNGTNMVAILPECGFMDNLQEASLMLDENYQQKCAQAIATGINKYLGVGVKQPTLPPLSPTPPLYPQQLGLTDIVVEYKGAPIRLKGKFQDGVNMIALREIEKFGLKVDYNNATKRVIVK